MNTFAIISDCYRDIDNRYKDFEIVLQNLTREQILAIKAAMPAYEETLDTSHPKSGYLKIEGIEFSIRREILFWLYQESYKIIPMWTINNFE